MVHSKAVSARLHRLKHLQAPACEPQLDREAARSIVEVTAAPVACQQRLKLLQQLLPDDVPLQRAQQVIEATKTASASSDVQRQAIALAVACLYPLEPKPEQVEAIWQLLFAREDMILIAKTSFGKSVPLQVVSLLQRGSITFTIIPLNSIGGQQEQRVAELGGSPLFLSSKNNTAATRRAIEQGKHTHVYLSLELAASKGMREVLSSPVVRRRMAAIMIDEAHLVDQWGRSFRQEFARLHILRTYVGKAVPWFACSATLSRYTVSKLVEKAGFDEHVRILRTSIDRPELFLSLGYLPTRPISKYAALRPFFDSMDARVMTRGPQHGKVDCLDIPKTVVFFNTKAECHEAQDAMVQYLTVHPFFLLPRARAMDMIRVYTSDTHELDQADIVETFAKPSRSSPIRFVFATEALAMGVDLPDIRRVVQYRLTQSLNPAILWQRGGRACRDQQPGEVVLLVDTWTRGERSQRADLKQVPLEEEELVDEGDATQSKAKPKRLCDAEKRCKLPNFWYSIINDSNVCIKSSFLDHYEEPHRLRVPGVHGCCSNCNPARAWGCMVSEAYAQYQLSEGRPAKTTAAARHVSQAVMAWATKEAGLRWKNARFTPSASCLLSPAHLRELEHSALTIDSVEALSRSLKGWRYLEQYKASLYETVADAVSSLDLASGRTGGFEWHVEVAPQLQACPTPRTGVWVFINETKESMAAREQQIELVSRRRRNPFA